MSQSSNESAQLVYDTAMQCTGRKRLNLVKLLLYPNTMFIHCYLYIKFLIWRTIIQVLRQPDGGPGETTGGTDSAPQSPTVSGQRTLRSNAAKKKLEDGVSTGLSPEKTKQKTGVAVSSIKIEPGSKNSRKRALLPSQDALDVVDADSTKSHKLEEQITSDSTENIQSTESDLGSAGVSHTLLLAAEDARQKKELAIQIDAVVKVQVAAAVKSSEKLLKDEHKEVIAQHIADVKAFKQEMKRMEGEIKDLNATIKKGNTAVAALEKKLKKVENQAAAAETRATKAESELSSISSPFSNKSLSPPPLGTEMMVYTPGAVVPAGRGRRGRAATPQSGSNSETDMQFGNSWALQSAAGIHQAAALMTFSAKKLHELDTARAGHNVAVPPPASATQDNAANASTAALQVSIRDLTKSMLDGQVCPS